MAYLAVGPSTTALYAPPPPQYGEYGYPTIRPPRTVRVWLPIVAGRRLRVPAAGYQLRDGARWRAARRRRRGPPDRRHDLGLVSVRRRVRRWRRLRFLARSGGMGGDATPRIRDGKVPVLDLPFVICFLLYAIYVIVRTKSIKIMHTYIVLMLKA